MKLKNKILKIIKEQISLIENSSSPAEHNFDVIFKQAWSDQSGMIYDSIFGSAGDVFGAFTGEYSDEEIEEKSNNIRGLINNISCLKAFKIEKAVTGRSFGKVFKMSNGHMLKIFSDSLNVQDDLEWYKEAYDKAFEGSANLNTLPIYDFGSFDPGDGADIHFVEMAEVMPLDKWIIYTKRGNESDARDGLSPLISFYDEMRREARKNKVLDMTKEDAVQMTLFMLAHARSSYEPFTRQEAEAILGAFWEAEQSGWSLQDTAVRNMGVTKQSDPNNPVVIIFDR